MLFSRLSLPGPLRDTKNRVGDEFDLIDVAAHQRGLPMFKRAPNVNGRDIPFNKRKPTIETILRKKYPALHHPA